MRIETRYALWEEQYIVSIIEPTGAEHHLTFETEAAFERWFSEAPLIATSPHPYGPSVNVRVKLKMLPFSSQEQSDTRRWLARTLSEGDKTSGEAESADVLRIIVETSTRRRPLLEREWSARAVREKP
jgi:hypothetical protein